MSLPGSGVNLATTIFDILLSSEPGRIERQAALVVLEEALSVGCSSREYVELVDAVFYTVAGTRPRDATWLSQCLDLLLLFSSQQPAMRATRFSNALAADLGAACAETPDLVVLELVFADAGLNLPRPAVATEPSNGVSRDIQDGADLLAAGVGGAGRSRLDQKALPDQRGAHFVRTCEQFQSQRYCSRVGRDDRVDEPRSTRQRLLSRPQSCIPAASFWCTAAVRWPWFARCSRGPRERQLLNNST